MEDNRRNTRSQSAQAIPKLNGDKLKGEDIDSEGVTKQGEGPTKPASAGDSAGETDRIDNTVLLAAVQSLGHTLEGYARRVQSIEDRLAEMSDTIDPLPSAPRTAVGDVARSQADVTLPQPAASSQTQTDSAPSVGVTRHFPRPGDFDGSGSWVAFIAQFKTIASAQAWSEADRLAALVASLKGSALEVFAHLPDTDRTDSCRLSAALESRFGAVNQEPLFRSQLRRRKRSAGETLPKLAQDIERLVSRAYPSATRELRDSLACDHFLDALNDPSLHIAVRQGRPESLQQALASAVEIESVRAAAGVTLQASNTGTVIRQGKAPGEASGPDSRSGGSNEMSSEVLTQILSTLDGLQKLLAGSSRSNRNLGARRQPVGTCWECGKEGHFRRQCPRSRTAAGDSSLSRQGNGQ